MQNKAFIFDMDGVIIDTENEWADLESNLMVEVFGPEVAKKIGSPIGLSTDAVIEKAKEHGSSVSREEYQRHLDNYAPEIFARSKISENIEDLANYLFASGFKIGLVTSSGLDKVGMVLPRISFGDKFETIISLQERRDLKHKPHPDGHLEAIKILGSNPLSTVILEDSNPGIQSAKATGAFTIVYRGNLTPGYVQDGADIYANHMLNVIEILKRRSAA